MSRTSGCLSVLVGLIAGCSNGNASTIINFSGNFIFDDDVQFFNYQAPTGGVVTVNTFSFQQGGFSPILTLYDPTGAQVFVASGVANNDCTIAPGGDIRGTGFCYDTSLSWDNIPGGTYHIALSQDSNFPFDAIPIPVNLPSNTWNNADTFTQFGNHFFTAQSPFGPGCGQPGFCLVDGSPRGSNWAVKFTGPNDLIASQVPEASTIFLILGGLAMLCGRLLRMRKRA